MFEKAQRGENKYLGKKGCCAMSFRIVPEVFDKLPELYIGALVVKGIDNTKDYPQVTEFLDECVQNLHRDLAGQKIKESLAFAND